MPTYSFLHNLQGGPRRREAKIYSFEFRFFLILSSLLFVSLHAYVAYTQHINNYTINCYVPGMANLRGAVLCCVCKRFCSAKSKKCPGCGKHCHEKCRQNICCRPCNSCWTEVLSKRYCVCGKSCRSLGVFLERQRHHKPLTPTTIQNIVDVTPPSQLSSLPTKRMRADDCDTGSHARRSLFADENVLPMEIHPHENSKDYMMRVGERGGNASRARWEDCRILSKFKIKKISGREQVMCTIECRQRQDLNETKPWRPEDAVR